MTRSRTLSNRILSNRILSNQTAAVIFCVLLGMLVLGSFIDFPLSQALYNEQDPFSVFFAAYGESPVTFGLVAAGAMLAAAHDREKKFAGILQMIGGAILMACGLLMACMMPTLYLSWPKAVIAAIGVCASVGIAFASFRLCRGAEPKTVRRVVLVIFLTILLDLVVVNIIKIPWGRARMRLVANDARAYFMPWWQPGTEQKDALAALGVAAEEFKSFPSGHAANSSAMMLLSILTWVCPALERKKAALFWCGFGWPCVTAFTRIVMGAHYLTDVTVGLTLGFAIFLLVTRFLPRRDDLF